MKRIVWTTLGLALLAAGCGYAGTAQAPDPGLGVQAASRVAAPVIATEVLSPNQDNRADGKITAIILHHTAVLADAASTARFFHDPKSKVSAHYVVDRDGSIIRCVPDAQKAWHAGVSSFNGVSNVNEFSVGIEIANVGDGVEPYPTAQVQSVIRLVAWLSSTHHVPLSNLTRHRDIAVPAGRKTDTSDNFDEEYVRKSAQALLSGRQIAAYRPGTVPAGYDPSRQTAVAHFGDTWTSLSEDHFDSPAMAQAIHDLNPGLTLRPGVEVRLPIGY